MNLQAYIEQVVFVSGLEISLQANSILVIVGPNNAGKSTFLTDIKGVLEQSEYHPITLREITLHKTTSIDDIKALYAQFRGSNGHYDISGFSFHEHNLNAWWGGPGSMIGQFLTRQTVSELTTRVRLSDCDPAPVFEATKPFTAMHPFQHMYYDDRLEQETSRQFQRAFKRDFILHRAAGNSIPAYIGDRPTINKDAGEDRVSRSYLERLEKLSRLEKQGDGMRSFASVIARVQTESRSIQLIDEPEAFLHPPQARLIAEIIATESASRQTFIATHSSDILQGLLGEYASRISVVRLSRKEEVFSAVSLANEKVMELWRNPILRFSNILAGLFHDGVIVTEADADCRFYEAMAGAAIVAEERPDIHYTYSGGKDRIPTVVAALASLQVPIVTIVDFDILNNDQPLRKIVEAHQADWTNFEADWKAVKTAVEGRETFLGGNRFRQEMMTQLNQYGKDEVVPKTVLSEIKKLARSASPWDSIKNSGLSGIAPGNPTITAQRLLTNLKKSGVFVAPYGEMEGFCRSVGSHGPRWVEEVLKRNLVSDPELLQAKEFVREIVRYLNKSL